MNPVVSEVFYCWRKSWKYSFPIDRENINTPLVREAVMVDVSFLHCYYAFGHMIGNIFIVQQMWPLQVLQACHSS